MQPVALITGSSRGIGRGIALELASARRHALIVHYVRNKRAGEQCAELCRDAGASRVEVLQGDVAVAADRERMIASVRERFGRLDLLVNNAGIAPPERVDVLEASEASFDAVLGTNLRGPYFLTQFATRLMIDSPPLPPAGVSRAVINITSVSAFAASTNRGDYCIAKAGLSMATKLWAVRLAEFGIGVFEIQPGVIATDMTAAVREKYEARFAEGLAPINRWGEPADVGRCVVSIALAHFPYSTGQVFQVDGGFHLRSL